jgi:predicted phosphodiesterase
MQTLAIDITVPKKYNHISIEPVTDIHRDDVNFVKSKWDEVLNRIASEPNRFTIGLGDYGSQIYTNANERRGPETINPEYRDDPMHLYDTLVSELAPLKKKVPGVTVSADGKEVQGKILLVIQGNHDHTVEKGSHINPVKDLLAKGLGVPYGGYTSMVSLRVDNGINKRVWKLFLTHGKVTGALPASSLTKLERLAQGFDADVYLAGDRHEILVDKRLFHSVSDDGLLLQGTRIFGVCGCFVAGYSAEKRPDGRVITSYPELIMGLPNRVGTLTIQFNLDTGRIYAHE